MTADNPGEPGGSIEPDNPDNLFRYPNLYEPQELSKTVSRDIFYIGTDGKELAHSIHQEVHFKGAANLDLVTGNFVNLAEDGTVKDQDGAITWTPEQFEFAATEPLNGEDFEVVGYGKKGSEANVDITNGVVSSEVVTANSANKTITLTLKSKSNIISFASASDEKKQDDQSIEKEISVNQETEPVEDTVVTGHQTVHQVSENGTDLQPVTATHEVTFVKNGSSDKWDKKEDRYDDIVAPVINGYVVKTKVAVGKQVTPEDPDQDIVLTYYPVGKIIPVDAEGKAIAKGVQYQNDEKDPTKVLASQKAPGIVGWNPNQYSIMPLEATKDTKITYTKVPNKPETDDIDISLDDLKMVGLAGLKINKNN